MPVSLTETPLGCGRCHAEEALGFEIAMAFQPIVDADRGAVFAQEALVRGPNGEGAGTVLAKVNDGNRYRFDQTCRVRAIETAAALGIDSYLNINFLPNAVYRPENCIRTTLAACERTGYPVDRIVFELTEGEKVDDPAHARRILDAYRQLGFKTAIDDFGAGYSGLGLLADFRTDFVKLDMGLVRNVHADRGRRAIVGGIVRVCEDLGIAPIAEGVETANEFHALRDLGIGLFQGYHIAKPAFRSLATVPATFLAGGVSCR